MRETASPKQNHDQFPSMIGVVEQMQQWTAVKAGDIRLMNAEMQLIRTLGCHDGISVGEAAKELGITKGAVSQTIGRLEKKGSCGCMRRMSATTGSLICWSRTFSVKREKRNGHS